MPFEYQAQGIRVQGSSYPIVKMEWVTGETLGSYLEAKHSDKSAMQALRLAFRELAKHLRSRGIAHGDIQTGNVMADAGRLILIDYDGMFVPGMPLGNATEIGHRHFQHPCRGPSYFGPEMDRFSFIAVDLTLAALAEQASLYTKYATTGENILFTGNDFKEPSTSSVFAELRRIPSLRKSAEDFAAVCCGPLHGVPDLDDFLAGRNIPTVAVTISTTGASRSAYTGSLPVIDGCNFRMASRHVGDRVELVGLITDVRIDVTRSGGRYRKGRRYVFINFGDWRGRIVKVNIWSTGLAKLRECPDSSWVGRWISVTGLMDPPYSNPKYHYTHISITVEEAQQLHFIDEAEAQYRLGKSGGSKQSSGPRRDNREVLKAIQNGRANRGGPKPTRRGTRGQQAGKSTSPSTPTSKNQAILQQINASVPTSSPPYTGSAPPAPSTPSNAGQQIGQRDRSGIGCLVAVAIVIILIFLFDIPKWR